MTEHQKYMNPKTGSVDSFEGWYYRNDKDELVNAVLLEEVVPVYWNPHTNCWVEEETHFRTEVEDQVHGI